VIISAHFKQNLSAAKFQLTIFCFKETVKVEIEVESISARMGPKPEMPNKILDEFSKVPFEINRKKLTYCCQTSISFCETKKVEIEAASMPVRTR